MGDRREGFTAANKERLERLDNFHKNMKRKYLELSNYALTT